MNTEFFELFEAATLLLSTRPRNPVDALFIHSRSFIGDDDGLFELVSELVPTFASHVVINGGDGYGVGGVCGKQAWPGVREYQSRLRSRGLLERTIVSEPAAHTREETEKFVDQLILRDWSRAIVINLPQYMLRTMLGAVSELRIRRMPHVRLYPAAPVSLDWGKPVFGPQGEQSNSRVGQCRGELERIAAYQKDFSSKFVSTRELVQYLVTTSGS